MPGPNLGFDFRDLAAATLDSFRLRFGLKVHRAMAPAARAAK